MVVNFNSIDGIGNITQQLYRSRLNRLVDLMDKSLDFILDCPYKTYHKIRKNYTNWNTINSYIVPIITIIQHMPDLIKNVSQKSIDDWNNISNYCREKCQLLKIENKNVKGVLLTYDDLLDKLNDLKGREQLVVAIYTLIPPVRCDYHKLKIMRYSGYIETTDINRSKENVILLPEVGKSSIVLINYKTKKAYGNCNIDLPDRLVDIIKSNCEIEQEYLFCDKKGQPYTRSAYSTIIGETLRRIFGQKLTINSLRHIYITHNVKLDTDSKKKMEIARKMQHSTDTQVKYIWAK